jgi:NADPH:quinone reductase-like Zn-dependent oxidoreductase
MKAIVYTKYGPPDVLQFEEIAKPTPADNEVLIKLYAASVNPIDLHLMRGKPLFLRLMSGGLRAPKGRVPGHDIAGRVEAIGRNVTQFKPGDEVFGACRGAFAEYVCAMENKLALKPPNSSFEDAAALPVAAVTALQGLRDKGTDPSRPEGPGGRRVWWRGYVCDRLPNRSVLKSLPCAASGMCIRRDQ